MEINSIFSKFSAFDYLITRQAVNRGKRKREKNHEPFITLLIVLLKINLSKMRDRKKVISMELRENQLTTRSKG